jgi:hypothetical protein
MTARHGSRCASKGADGVGVREGHADVIQAVAQGVPRAQVDVEVDITLRSSPTAPVVARWAVDVDGDLDRRPG